MTTDITNKTASLSGLHLLLTYECNFECDHCFVWGGPGQRGTMTEETVRHILDEAHRLGTIDWIYFEGGEVSLHYDLLVAGAEQAKSSGFQVGMVTNAYWAQSPAEAREWLRPFAGILEDLSISEDEYHGAPDSSAHTRTARSAARELGIPVDYISVAQPEATGTPGAAGKLPAGESAVLFRGRAAEKLASRAQPKPWDQFDRCPWEDLAHPERVHVDAYGNLHVCQGISIGNLLERPLREIMRDYEADIHPIVGPLLSGGPAALIEAYGLPHRTASADACHLCYRARCSLRDRFPEALTPDQMYGSVK
jgi:hypothetical protein